MALPRPAAAVHVIFLAVQLVFSTSAFAQEAPALPGGAAPLGTTAEGAAEPAAAPRVSPAVGPLTPDPWAEYIRAQEIVRLRVRVDLLRESNRNKPPPGVMLGTGLASLLVGAIVFARAWNAPDEYSVARDRAGLVLMPVGALLTVIAAPFLGVRLSRALRLGRAERALRAVEGQP